MSLSDSRLLRQRGIAFAKREDIRVKYLYETCKWLNRNARFEGWTEKLERYSVDHIVPLNDQGKFGFGNLWICPLSWNIDNAVLMPKRGMQTIWAIRQAVRETGNVHVRVPEQVLVAERRDLIAYLGVDSAIAYGLIPPTTKDSYEQ